MIGSNLFLTSIFIKPSSENLNNSKLLLASKLIHLFKLLFLSFEISFTVNVINLKFGKTDFPLNKIFKESSL